MSDFEIVAAVAVSLSIGGFVGLCFGGLLANSGRQDEVAQSYTRGRSDEGRLRDEHDRLMAGDPDTELGIVPSGTTTHARKELMQ